MRRCLALVVVVLLVGSYAQRADAQSALSPLTNADVTRFVAMGLSEQVIGNLIYDAKVAGSAKFDLSQAALDDLALHGVALSIIAAMREQVLTPAPPAVLPSAPAVSSPVSGIRPLTPETFEVAKAELGDDFSGNYPPLIRLRSASFTPGRLPTDQEMMASRRVVMETQDLPFSFFIVSPYTVVAAIAKEASRTYSKPTFPTIQTLNAALVVLQVGPGDSMATADAIQSVVIKRGDQIIRPLKSFVTPTIIQNRMGARQASAKGVFTFDYSTFAPDVAITIVMIGDSGNLEWTMPPEELRQLK